jgi:hypothetical protein
VNIVKNSYDLKDCEKDEIIRYLYKQRSVRKLIWNDTMYINMLNNNPIKIFDSYYCDSINRNIEHDLKFLRKYGCGENLV